MTAEIDTVLAYHERTKHHLDRYARSTGHLDWENQPDPFRRYEGATTISLAHCDDAEGPLYHDLFKSPVAPSAISHRTISQLFYYSMALSAWKKIPQGDAWSLRVNPSSGNLHPTESYLIIGPGAMPAIKPGLYHYDARHHALEERRFLTDRLWRALASGIPAQGFFIGLSSIYWREAWKYGERAYRYCHHDVGHALGAITVAAASLGWRAQLIDNLAEDDLGISLGIESQTGNEAEHGDSLVVVYPGTERRVNNRQAMLSRETIAQLRQAPLSGKENSLSANHHEWPVIDEVSSAAKKTRRDRSHYPDPPRLSRPVTDLPQRSDTAFQIIRQRRSAVAMDGVTGMDRQVFFNILHRLQWQQSVPFECLPWPPNVSLFLFVHRVRDLDAGLYALVRDESHETSLRGATNPNFLWTKPQGVPQTLGLFLLSPQDLREESKIICCHQDIAADGVFSLGMLARFDEIRHTGAHFYPRLFWETGLIGQLLYLEAEAAGLRSTGIGCFFDDVMHEVLGITDQSWQSLYHFTVGGPLEDSRLQTYTAYPPGA